MNGKEGLEQARDAYQRRDWAAVLEGHAPLGDGEATAEDLFALADAAWWLGEVDRSIAAAEAAYRRFLQGDRPVSAAMAAMTVAMNLLLRGDVSLGSGWMGRAVRLVADRPDTPEFHYLRYLTEVEGLIGEAGRLSEEEAQDLLARAREVRATGHSLGDPNLVAAGAAAEGRVLLKRGRGRAGLAVLDEAMVCLVDGDLSPDWAGSVYCHLMAACDEVADFGRAREWTAATERWLETLPAAVLFQGICRVHRSHLLQAFGAWDRAEAEARCVCEELAAIAPATVGEAQYLLGELRRVRGDLRGAEACFEHAHRCGRDPEPGMSLLRLAQGRHREALASVRAALLACGTDLLACVPLWAAQVDIAVAAGDLAAAEAACAAVEAAASSLATSGFEAEARRCRGAVELARGRAEQALPVLRDACNRWLGLGCEHTAARTRLLLARAYDALGASDSADRERRAAAACFDRLGISQPSLGGEQAKAAALPAGLTAREAEVLGLVAAGRSNRDVASRLGISEKTVGRHLSNIFTKIGAASRTEAAAFAFHHGLTAPKET